MEGQAASEPAVEPVIGCPPSQWPTEGVLYVPPPIANGSTRLEAERARFMPRGLSGNGRIVVGETIDPESSRRMAAAWSSENDLVELLGAQGEAAAMLASCDGSVLLARDERGDVYRVEAGATALLFDGAASAPMLSMNPRGTEIIDGAGPRQALDERVAIAPRRWSRATGTRPLPAAAGASVYHVAADGSWIGARASELFRYHPSTDTAEAIGAAPLPGADTIVVARGGDAWIQSTAAELDAFLWKGAGRDPIEVRCPGPCALKGLSSNGSVALLDDLGGNVVHSWLWSERGGFVDLADLFAQNRIELGERVLRAVAMSDDGRAFAGQSYDASAQAGSTSFFYGVLPASAYE
jgi:hypothetical protein